MSKFTILKICCILFFIFLLFTESNPLFYLIPLILFIGFTSWGVFDIRLSFFNKNFCNSNTTIKELAITFDDGPNELTPKFLEILEKFQAKATFFCIGKNVEKYPEIVKSIIQQGHTIGNHTFNHSNQNGFFNTSKVIDEISKTENVIYEITGMKTNLFRPPFGITNPNIAKAINKLQYRSIGWNIRSLDTVIKNPNQLYKKVKNKVNPGSIILFHDNSLHSLIVLEQLLRDLSKDNYTFKTVDDLLKIKAYKNEV